MKSMMLEMMGSMALAVPVLASIAVLGACAQSVNGQPDIKLNPSPKQRYEIVVTSDAPGKFDSVEGRAYYQVDNVGCVPKDSFTGGQNVPGKTYMFKLVKVDDKTYTGQFFKDRFEPGDYFGLGVCHWKLVSVGPDLVVHGDSFGPALITPNIESGGVKTRYFKKSEFFNRSISSASALSWSANDSEYLEKRELFFSITVSVSRAGS